MGWVELWEFSLLAEGERLIMELEGSSCLNACSYGQTRIDGFECCVSCGVQ